MQDGEFYARRDYARFRIWMEERNTVERRIQRIADAASRAARTRRDYGLFINSQSAIAEELMELRENQEDPVYEHDEILASIEATFYD